MLAKGGLAALLLGCASPVHAETLKEALTAAYLYNPTLKAAQAQLRSTDNSVSLAKSGYRPTISSTSQYGFEDFRATTRGVTSQPGTVPTCPGAVNANGTCDRRRALKASRSAALALALAARKGFAPPPPQPT